MKNTPIDIFEQIGNQSEDFYFLFDLRDRVFKYFNNSFSEIWQVAMKDFLDKPALILNTIHKDERKEVYEFCKAFREHKRTGYKEFRILLPDGKESWVSLTLYAIKEEEKFRFAAGVVVNESLRKKNEFQMLKINAKKNAMLEILSHDLTGPIGLVQMMASAINKNIAGADNERISKWSVLIQEICERNIKLIRELVNQEFLESSEMDLVVERVDLVWEIEETISMYKHAENELLKTFIFNCKQDKLFVYIDSLKFMQVINNLISNAIKFTPDNGTIKIDLIKLDHSILCTVEDNGIGIPDKHLPVLFEKFTPARRQGLKGEETLGLGMSIIQLIVNLHQGKVWCESKEGYGTKFYVEIPDLSPQKQ
jgi:two-component system sensor histidine kinase VicK